MASSRHINGKAHFFAEGKDTSLCGKMQTVNRYRQTIPLENWDIASEYTCPVCRAYLVWKAREVRT